MQRSQIADYCEAHPEDKEDTPKDVLHGKAFLTPREAAKLLGIGKSSVYRELASGLIKAVQMKGKTLIRRADIERLFDNPPVPFGEEAGEARILHFQANHGEVQMLKEGYYDQS